MKSAALSFRAGRIQSPTLHRCRVWISLVCLAFGAIATAGHEIVFDGLKSLSEIRLEAAELGPEFPQDWSDYQALVLELRVSSSQRFSLKVYSGDDQKFSRVVVQPYPGAWIRTAIPVAVLTAAPSTGYDMASVGNRSRPGYYLGLWGPFIPLKAVHALGFAMENPIGSPRLEIRSVSVVKQSPGDAVLEPLPLVDEFGQWIHADWPGKANSLEALKLAWEEERRGLDNARPFGLCRYGGFTNSMAAATGFFRVEKQEGKWWFVDPDGHLFLSVGSDVIRPEMVTRLTGRTNFFRQLPPNAQLDGRSGDDGGVSFFTWNLNRRFGPNWRPQWIDFTLRRMDAWGLNTVANWSDPELWQAARKPYVLPLGRWDSGINYLGLPDVYSERFSKSADAAAEQQCRSRRNDPWLLGYFLANEPPFPQKELQTAELILAGPDSATKRALQEALAHGDSPQARKEFIQAAFDRYIQITSAAVKKHDPNHLNLGMRSGGRPTDAEIRVARAFDVYSVNIYDRAVSPERMKQIEAFTGKPVLIGEFHFGVPERGLAASLVQVKNEHERGVAYRHYVEEAFALPSLIGTHWFQWADQPSTGRYDGENYNIGLVDVTDRPYPELIEAMRLTHSRLYDVHAGRTPAFSESAQIH